MKLLEIEGKSQVKKSNRIKKTLLSLLFVVTGFVSYAQVTPKEPTLDGTEGEVFKEKDTIASEKKISRANEFENDFSTLRFGGGFMYEHAFYSQDEESKDQVQLSPGFIVRDFRVTMSGKLKTERDISWKVGVMYDGASRSWLVRESGVMIGFPKLSGHIFIGRTKEGYSLSKVMNGYSMWHVERAMAIDIIPILADGVKYMGFLPKQKINWNIGYFNDFLSEEQSFSKYKWQFASRIGYLPIYTDAVKPVMHIGVNYRYGETKDGKLQVRSRPEANGAPYFVDTGTFSVNNSNHIGGEFYYRSGAFLFGSEYNLHMMNSRETKNPIFKGGEVFLAYSITGEVRPYLSNPGIFTFLKPKKSVFEGGYGGWEAILRFSSLDLNDGTLTGGEFWRITPMVNWYLSENIRFYFAYGYGVLDKDNQQGVTNFFQSRVLLML
ncbi:hypothetical protein FLJC2902T_15850 [Flavobacterium limnosediminis JC2902]|uniref:Phosphate-selective porin O and P n=1 Tax=Flavobacterium limnosediminis JC2902 TaxID=1341181 RepID=V6SNH1_9FLAO|nr:porin [Flavobacterium limnosediminis]ESU28238.1 hypothetical protein FLJC2902T_15850 [Flavobacterium limnosediminis JC2902]